MPKYCIDCDKYEETKECPNWRYCYKAFQEGHEYTKQDIRYIEKSLKIQTLDLKPGMYYICEIDCPKDRINHVVEGLKPFFRRTGVADILFVNKGFISNLEEKALFIKHLSFSDDETGQIVVKDRFKSDEFAEDYKTYSDIMFTALTELTNANLYGKYKIIIMEEK